MHKGTNKILPNMCTWAHLKANWVHRIYLRSFLFCADVRRNSEALLQVFLENWVAGMHLVHGPEKHMVFQFAHLIILPKNSRKGQPFTKVF